MAHVKWDKLKEGDFFISETLKDLHGTLLYQKIKQTGTGYNAVLLNSGELCQLYIPADSDKTFQKVEVTFDIKPTE
jgi:hypothetical protein